MAISAAFSVTTSAPVLLATGTDDSTEVSVLANTATNLLHIGHSGVTTANGFKVGTLGTKHTVRLGRGETLYGIAETGTVDVRVLISNG